MASCFGIWETAKGSGIIFAAKHEHQRGERRVRTPDSIHR